MSQHMPVWLVAYTYPKSEKKAHEKLQRMGLNSFLPLYTKVQQWSDRKKKVEFPLFPSYLFIRTTLAKRFEALNVRELVQYVSFSGETVIVRDKEIETIHQTIKGITGEVSVLNQSFDQKGLPVIVTKGPMTGLRGTVEETRGKKRLLIKVKSLRQVICLEVTADVLIKDDGSPQLAALYPIPTLFADPSHTPQQIAR